MIGWFTMRLSCLVTELGFGRAESCTRAVILNGLPICVVGIPASIPTGVRSTPVGSGETVDQTNRPVPPVASRVCIYGTLTEAGDNENVVMVSCAHNGTADSRKIRHRTGLCHPVVGCVQGMPSGPQLMRGIERGIARCDNGPSIGPH